MNWLTQIPSTVQLQYYEQCNCTAPTNPLATAIHEKQAAKAMEQINEDMEHTRQTLGTVSFEYHFKV
jgi:hypothetical protein